jgi:hypothetical protein
VRDFVNLIRNRCPATGCHRCWRRLPQMSPSPQCLHPTVPHDRHLRRAIVIEKIVESVESERVRP